MTYIHNYKEVSFADLVKIRNAMLQTGVEFPHEYLWLDLGGMVHDATLGMNGNLRIGRPVSQQERRLKFTNLTGVQFIATDVTETGDILIFRANDNFIERRSIEDFCRRIMNNE